MGKSSSGVRRWSTRRHSAPDLAAIAGWAVTSVATALFLAACWRLRDFVTDDSWISVRYAENLAAGVGAVWNPGGPRTEGFSNPLLVYLEALADAAGWAALPAARTAGVLCGLACVILVYAGGRRVVGRMAAATGAVFTGVAAPFALWSVGGLETTLTALALTAAVLQVARPDGGRPVVAGVLLALLPWLRPEGLVVALAVVGAGEVAGLLRRGSRGPALRRVTLLAGLPVLSQAVLEAFRLSVYGHLLPNSVHYKSGTGETFAVAEKFVGHSTLVLLLAGTGVLLARRRQLVLAVPVLVYLAGSIGTLDSANSYSRFFMPVWPTLALLAGLTVSAVARGARDRAGLAAPAGLAVLTVVATTLVLPGNLAEVDSWQQRYMHCRVDARVEAARWLRTSTPPGTTFAVSDAGYVPARADRTAIDSFLLNDPLIQRTGPLNPRQRADIVHDRRPDVLVLATREATRFDPVYPTERALGAHPAAEDFQLAHVASGDPDCGYHLMLLQRSG